MSTLEMILFGSLTPLAAILIGLWVLHDVKKTTARAHARAARERRNQTL